MSIGRKIPFFPVHLQGQFLSDELIASRGALERDATSKVCFIG